MKSKNLNSHPKHVLLQIFYIWFAMLVVETFSAILKKSTKRKTFFVIIKHNDNDHRKKMFLYSDITDCLNLLTAFMEILGGV